MASQPISSIVNVSASIEAGGVLFRTFGIGLFMTPDDTLNTTGDGRILLAQDMNAVASVFSSTSAPYKAAQAWFAQSPSPKNLIIGRWIESEVGAILNGGKVTLLPADFAAFTTTKGLTITVSGNVHTAASVDLTGVTTYAAVAAAMQTALVAASAAVTVTYDATQQAFVVATTALGGTVTISACSGTLAADAKLDTASIASIKQGAFGETLEDAFNVIQAINNSASLIMLDNITEDSQKVDFAGFIETQKQYSLVLQSSDAAILQSSDTTSIAYTLFAEQVQYSFLTYSALDDYKAVSVAAKLSSVNLDALDSVITLKFKALPTLLPDTFTAQQIAVMKSKGVSFYTEYATQPMYDDGRCFKNGVWADTIYYSMWFVNNVQVSVFDLLVSTPRVPQTDGGEALITDAMSESCKSALFNGMIATGTVSDEMKNDIITTTGNSNFNGVLLNGYMVYSQPSAAQSKVDRNSRKATAKKIWLKSSGAIHSADISVTLEN